MVLVRVHGYNTFKYYVLNVINHSAVSRLVVYTVAVLIDDPAAAEFWKLIGYITLKMRWLNIYGTSLGLNMLSVVKCRL